MKTIEWRNNAIRIIDQTRLPGELRFLSLTNTGALIAAIKELKVRGAPALGAAAALGVYIGIRGSKAKDFAHLSKDLERTGQRIAASRPTARNLFWGIERALAAAARNRHRPIAQIKRLVLQEALCIMEEDRTSCRAIGRVGDRLVKKGDTVLTVCNAGALATIDYGTAVGVLYRAHEKGKRCKVFACETRPLLQGARLTTWELMRHGIDTTLICDNMAATVMQQGRVDLVITGADRIAANGDAANKIGTYMLAVLARHHKIPFYVAAPRSTFDLRISSGKKITIEERKGEEITSLWFKRPMAAKGVHTYNPAFDVTPHHLITAFITEKGIIRPPFAKNIRKRLCG